MNLLQRILLFSVLALSACADSPHDELSVNAVPPIYPDYVGVTIPAQIAPLNFNVLGSPDCVDVTLAGSKGGSLHANGKWADLDIDDWHELTAQNVGGTIAVNVSARFGKEWRKYKPFEIHVSEYELSDYGLTYRRIPPGYEVGGDIGIYQRELASFSEEALLCVKAIPEQCMSCHTANATNPNRVTLQVRGKHGGSLVMKDGQQRWLNTRTDTTRAACSYAYWHPDGRFIVFTSGTVGQNFFVGTTQPIEVHHAFSSIVMLDTETDEIFSCPQLLNDQSVTLFPAFSPDGRTIYFSSSTPCHIPAEYEKVKCSIVSIGFDAENQTFDCKLDTLLNGEKDSCSYVLARPSYDGRWLMLTRCSRSNFPIDQPDADLYMYDLKTKQLRSLDALNSDRTDSYHSWSANSHWVVIASKREDGVYTRLYLASIDDEGNATKPFLLPQRNPRQYYSALFDAYNVPDFTSERVRFDAHEAYRQLFSDGIKSVTFRSQSE